jgi:uncharacterized protein (TIGR03663 family)
LQFTANSKYYLTKNGGVILLSAIFLLAVFIRVYRLNEKPMHVDEAVHAIKFGYLLENNYYRYNPVEFHGPTLNYFTLIPAWILNERTISEVTETTLRIVPVFAGLLLLTLLFYLKNIGKDFLLSAIVLTGFSSLIVFYNRYYIQESLLVSFSYCAIILLYKFYKSQKLIHLTSSAFLFALAFASKETSIITFFAIIISLIMLHFLNHNRKFHFNWKQTLTFIAVFTISAEILFTSFFSNLKGALDSLLTFTNYFGKAGSNTEHIQPFYYYFSFASFTTFDEVFLAELIIIVFFLFGLVRSFRKINSQTQGISFIKFLSLFTLSLIIIYSIIPYKTPWTMMSFWEGMLLVSAFGFAELRKFITKTYWNLLLLLVGSSFFVQSYYISIVHSSIPQNPFVYSHAESDVKLIEDLVLKISDAQSEKRNTPIYIAAPKSDYWPLPWYLRKFNKTSWNKDITEDVYKFPIVITTPEYENDLIEKLYSKVSAGSVNLYVPLFARQMEIRPGKEIRGYIRKEYYDNFFNDKNH